MRSEKYTLEWKLPLRHKGLRGLLVRVGAVAQCHPLHRPGQALARRGIGILLPKIPADGLVVLRRHLECLEREFAPDRLPDVALPRLPRVEKLGVVRRVREHRDARVVLRRCTEEGDAADIDLLDGICERAVGLRYGLGERVEVADDDRDGGDGLGGKVLMIGGDVARKDTCCPK